MATDGLMVVRGHRAFATAPLSGLAIPGSDNAGTYNLDPQGVDVAPGSHCVDLSTQHPAPGEAIEPWSATQDETVTQQLNDGIRWIDLQVGFNGTTPVAGWRVVDNLFSELPLSGYLDQVAVWAASHTSEAVFVDLRTICYDHQPTRADDEGLWANFATASDEAGGSSTINQVAFDATSLGARSLATATLATVTGQGGGGHNVVVLVPAGARDPGVLTTRYHVHPVTTVAPGSRGAASGTTVGLEESAPGVAPTTSDGFEAANHALEAYPRAAHPAWGSGLLVEDHTRISVLETRGAPHQRGGHRRVRACRVAPRWSNSTSGSASRPGDWPGRWQAGDRLRRPSVQARG
jgi:hypothetical protein